MKEVKKGTIDGFLAERDAESIHKAVALECLEAEIISMEEYFEILEAIQEEEEMRKAAYRKMAEYLWRKGAPADVYEQWLEICIKEGAL